MDLGRLHRNSCFSLLGFDVILDRELRPWLLEINMSPSLRCDSPVDNEVKVDLGNRLAVGVVLILAV